MKKTILSLLVGLTLLTACKKDKNAVQETKVYVAGHQWDSVVGNDRSTVWTNGKPATNQMSANNNHYAYGIFVNGKDVYTTGFENQGSTWKAQVWKNSLLQYTLGSSYGYGKGIAVAGSDIYVAGGAYTTGPATYYAMLWKNQNGATTLVSNNSNALATCVTVSGQDVYVGGNEFNSGMVWKNGIALAMTNTAGFPISCIAVSGTDVYAASSNGSIIRYWKNGTPTDISATAGHYAHVTGIAIDGSDVYVSGFEYNGSIGIAKYWKNGTAVVLGDGIRSSRANAIAIHNGDIYVAGEVAANGIVSDYATVWKNGIPTTIGNKNSRAMAITVK